MLMIRVWGFIADVTAVINMNPVMCDFSTYTEDQGGPGDQGSVSGNNSDQRLVDWIIGDQRLVIGNSGAQWLVD